MTDLPVMCCNHCDASRVDCAHADNFRLTHQFLADMLGLQRSAVTIAAGALHEKNLISYTRGQIRITDRQGLEAAACVCYAQLNAAYERLFAPHQNVGSLRTVRYRTDKRVACS